MRSPEPDAERPVRQSLFKRKNGLDNGDHFSFHTGSSAAVARANALDEAIVNIVCAEQGINGKGIAAEAQKLNFAKGQVEERLKKAGPWRYEKGKGSEKKYYVDNVLSWPEAV
jgi:hypothetical protein